MKEGKEKPQCMRRQQKAPTQELYASRLLARMKLRRKCSSRLTSNASYKKSGVETSCDDAKGSTHKRVPSIRRTPKAANVARVQAATALSVLGKGGPRKAPITLCGNGRAYGWNEVTRCRAFPLSLVGQA